MPQFDVHRNVGAHRAEIPFVVVVQSSRLEAYHRRVVVPLVRADAVGAIEPTLNPIFVVDGQKVVLHPLEIVSVSVDRLGDPVASLSAEADRIIAAVDVVITQAWR